MEPKRQSHLCPTKLQRQPQRKDWKIISFWRGQLFCGRFIHSKLKLTTTTSDEDSFQPMPAYSRSKWKRSMKRKVARAEILMEKGPVKKKVKQVVLPVVGLQEYCNRTPTGAARSKLTRDVWISTGSSENVVKSKIAEAFGWENTIHIGFLFAQGRSLCRASLSYVENSSSWDLETVKVLMGSGALYVVDESVLVSGQAHHDSEDLTNVSD